MLYFLHAGHGRNKKSCIPFRKIELLSLFEMKFNFNNFFSSEGMEISTVISVILH